MDDLISRQAAFDAVNEVMGEYAPYLYGRLERIPLTCAGAIKKLPSVKTARGQWKVSERGRYRCTLCGGSALYAVARFDGVAHVVPWMTEYCPHCGAALEFVEEAEDAE